MKSNYEAISIDLDGTLLDDKNNIDDYTINILKKVHSKGIKIIISTGRSLTGIPDILRKLNIIDYYILSNGTSCYDNKKNNIFKVCINTDLIGKLIIPNEKFSMEFLIDDKWYIDSMDESKFSKIIEDENVLNYILKTRIKKENLLDYIKSNMLLVEKINFNFSKDYKLAGNEYVNEIVKKSNGQLRCWTDKPHKIDLYNKEATKGKSLIKLLNYIKADSKKIVAFGDDENDADLLENVGLPIAMENAYSKIKSICKKTTSSNNEDGVANELIDIFEL